MITIATLFDKDANEQTKSIWEFLELTCSLSEILTAPIPHFSWQSASQYRIENLDRRVDEFVDQLPCFVVKTSGIGIFSGQAPIIYLPIVKTKFLVEIHEQIWREFSRFANDINILYAPDKWVPHITIARGDVTPAKISCALGQLASADLTLEIVVDNLTLLSNHDKNPQVDYIRYFSEDNRE